MGFQDRDYSRNDAGGSFARMVAPGRACKWLLIANIACYLIQVLTMDRGNGLGDWFTNALDLQPNRVLHGEVWRLVTHAFLHSPADPFHLIFNMLALWWFGRSVEDIYGPKEFFAFYFAGAVIAGLAWCGYDLFSGGTGHALGASGAVSAVMVLFAMHYPTATVLLFFVIPVPVIALVVLYAANDMLGIIGVHGGAKIAFAAHLAGSLFGFLYFKFQWRVLNWWPTRMSMRPNRLLRPKLRVYREPELDDTALAGSPDDAADGLEAEVDRVLEKLKLSGKASLSERENQVLLKASEVYRQRRK